MRPDLANWVRDVDSQLKAHVIEMYCRGELTLLQARQIIKKQGWESV